MNRKLLNGFLVVAVAAGGVVTFTSCKDEDYLNQIIVSEDEELTNAVTSIEINGTYNPVVGQFSIPVDAQSTVLGAYVMTDVDSEFEFPAGADITNFANQSPVPAYEAESWIELIQGLSPQKGEGVSSLEIVNGNYTLPNGFGNMGSIYATINPLRAEIANNPVYSVEVVDALGNTVFESADLQVMQNPDPLKFGYTRADDEEEATNSGVYKVNVNVNENIDVLDLNKAKDYVGDVKDALKNKSLSDVAYLGSLVYHKLNNRYDRLALKVNWTENDEHNDLVSNSTLSKFNIMAGVISPLSYGTPLNDVLGDNNYADKIPTFSPLEDYLEKISGKLDLTWTDINHVEANLTFTVHVESDKVYFDYYNSNGELVSTAEFDYTASGIQADAEELQSFVQAIVDANNEAYEGSLVASLNEAIDNINSQLKSYTSTIDDAKGYIDDFKNSSKLDYANKLITIYNKLAMKLQDVLKNPEHYLQVAAFYTDDNGYAHHLSTNPAMGSPVKGGIDIYAASYTADLVVPSYLKYVAITQVDGQKASAKDNEAAGEFANTVYPGTQVRFPLDLSSFGGKTLTITYVSVDYHGKVSMQNYYVAVQK